MMDGREEDRIAAVVLSGLALFFSFVALAVSIVALIMH